jgi:diguanylate cyclase (GGDEF)-like protein
MNKLCKYPNAKILIIDDSEEQVDLLKVILSSAGYKNISCCLDPQEAVDAYRRIQPDVTLLDYHMPGMSGTEVLSNLTELYPEDYLGVLVVTADSERNIKLEALNAGAQDFISKPVNKLEVLARLNTVIAASSLHKNLRTENRTLGREVWDTKLVLASEQKQRQKIELQLEHDSLHDRLTGLPNKTLFLSNAEQALAITGRIGKQFAIVVINIGNIKVINNTLGHESGDVFLKTVADNLRSIVRSSDVLFFRHSNENTIARLTGNSFVIGLTNLEDKSQATEVITRYVSQLKRPYRINDIDVELVFHIGYAMFSDHGRNVEELLKKADIAAYQAKQNHSDIYQYSSEYDNFTTQNLSLMGDLKKAIVTNQLELYIQPKVLVSTQEIFGFEALIRWHHPEYGFIAPDRFVTLAEDTGQISLLTEWVVKQSALIQARLQSQGIPYELSINITAADLLNTNIIDVILERLSQSNYQSNSLTLEITESTVIKEPDKVVSVLNMLANKGASISIDDFGTGYSSLAYLQKLPVHELKIDRSFVMDMHRNPDQQMIVRSTIDIAHNLDMSVVAEGVEDAESLAILNSLKCDKAQGYYVSKPLAVEKMIEFVKNYQTSLDTLKSA